MRPRESDYASFMDYSRALDEWKRGQAREEKRLLGETAVKALRAEIRMLECEVWGGHQTYASVDGPTKHAWTYLRPVRIVE